MIVDSSATIGFLADRASATSGKNPKDRRRSSLIAFIAGGRDQPRGYRQSPLHDQWRDLRRNLAAPSDSLRSGGFTLPSRRKRGQNTVDGRQAQNVPVQPDLIASIRQARVENAERAEAIAEVRELEIVRLKALESALQPVVDQAPPGVDLFDMALAPGEHPRLFLDMVAFVDMAHDKRTYRFYQDTRHGRMLIAENQSADTIVAAVADYVARRLVERERALTTDWRVARSRGPTPEANGPATWPIAKPRTRALTFRLPPRASRLPPPISRSATPARIARRLGDAFSMFLMLLGSITLRATAWDRRLLGVDRAPARPVGSLDRRAAVLNRERGLDLLTASHDNTSRPITGPR